MFGKQNESMCSKAVKQGSGPTRLIRMPQIIQDESASVKIPDPDELFSAISNFFLFLICNTLNINIQFEDDLRRVTVANI